MVNSFDIWYMGVDHISTRVGERLVSIVPVLLMIATWAQSNALLPLASSI